MRDFNFSRGRAWVVALATGLSLASGVSLAQPEYTVVHSFAGTDGANPSSPLIQAPDGFFYGTTSQGGAGNAGTVFRVDPTGGQFNVLHEFSGLDGQLPVSPLIQTQPPDAYFYGTTCQGGAHSAGTVFRISPTGDVFSVLHDFASATDGGSPCSALVQAADGKLYGTTWSGGEHNFGTIFNLDTAGTNFQVVLACSLTDCANPKSALIRGSDQNLYGASYNNVMLPEGVIFRFDTGGGGFTPIYSDLDEAASSLIQASDSYLYGAVSSSLFRLSLTGTDFLTRPVVGSSALQEGADGRVYGTTIAGGGGGGGTLFRLDYASDFFAQVLRDCAGDGWAPAAPPIQGADGAMYGTATRGGDHDEGVVYKLNLIPIYTIFPSSGPASGGTTIEIYAWNVVSGATLLVGGQVPSDVIVSEPNRTITATSPALSPGTLNDVRITNPDGTFGTERGMWLANFLDVPWEYPFHFYVERLIRAGVTAGCGSGNYCPQGAVTRAQMAVFLLRAEHGVFFRPPPCEGLFQDVACAPTPAFAADWIEELYRQGVTAGCGPASYCPDDPVTRAEMAVFLLKTVHGSSYVPPVCQGLFDDVPCAPTPAFAVNWIEELYREGITAGCSAVPFRYCPDDAVKRGQMAVFLFNAFAL